MISGAFHDSMRDARRRWTLVRAVAARSTVFAVIWWAIAEGEVIYWPLVVIVVLAAVVASLALVPPATATVHPLGLIRFLPMFARLSLLGGLDVARRAYSPRLPIDPGYVTFQLRLPDGLPRAVFLGVISLLPGTLSVIVVDERLRLHALDRHRDYGAALAEVESRVAGLFGIPVARLLDQRDAR